jgi:hypothetical protein
VIVRDEARYREKFGHRGRKVLGVYRGYLSDGGERLSLEDYSGREVARIDYEDGKPWPKEADGDGSWLQFTGESLESANDPALWKAGAE